MSSIKPKNFNSDNDENSSLDSRSDDKEPEPEEITTGLIKGHTFAFVSLST